VIQGIVKWVGKVIWIQPTSTSRHKQDVDDEDDLLEICPSVFESSLCGDQTMRSSASATTLLGDV
jgi:hypothetical protein